jgi:hypothetical protein
MRSTYRLLYRPPGFATLPSGLRWENVEVPAGHPNPFDLPVSRHPFGIIRTERPLTPEEMERFEIVAA